MFQSWRNNKNKIKAVFRLQFQCTKVPKVKKSAVMISLVPDDVGKPTFKLAKAPVQDGTCSWENPIYVTVKLLREPKTGYIKEKIYHFIVSTGSSKSGFLGEASIDFADFAAETEPLTVTLPLKFANSGAILHVTIEKMEGAIEHRYIEETRDKNQKNNYNTHEQHQNFVEEDALESCWDSNSDQNIQQDPSSLHSPCMRNSMPQKEHVHGIKTNNNHAHRRSNTDWSVGSISDGSLADSINSPNDNLTRGQNRSDGSVEKLKNEIAMLMRQAELSELEVQSLRKQAAKERKQAQEQTSQIISLSEERDALNLECEQLRKQNSVDVAETESRLQSENEHLTVLQEEIREELNYEKGVSAHLRMQLEMMQDSNAELILAVKDLNEMLEQKNREISSLSSKLEESKIVREEQLALQALAMEQNNDKEVDKLKQKIIDQSDEIAFFKKHSEDLEIYIKQLTEDCEILKQENLCLSSELEKYQQETSTRSRKSMSLESKTELESQVERLEEKIKRQSKEYSESVIFINELECQVKELKRELEKQAQEFEDDLDALTRAKTEQELRAIRAEEELRKTRCKNIVCAERLQEEFKRLSVEMEAKFEENEKTTRKALTEADELRMQKINLEEMLQKAKVEHDRKSSQLEDAQKTEAQKHEAFSMEINMLRTELEGLKKSQYNFSKHGKIRDDTAPSVSSGKTDMLITRWNRERDELEKKFASAKKEAAKAHEELISMRSLKDEKEILIENFQAEVEKLRVQQNKLQISLMEEKTDKHNLIKQVLQIKGELQMEEEEITSIPKVVKNYGGPVSDEQKTSSWKDRLRSHKDHKKSTEAKVRISENSSPCTTVDMHKHTIRNEGMFTEKGLNVLDSQTGNEGNFTVLLTEVTQLKEKNKHMESELKDMQERYSEISLKFAEVEGERQQLVMAVRNLKNVYLDEIIRTDINGEKHIADKRLQYCYKVEDSMQPTEQA